MFNSYTYVNHLEVMHAFFARAKVVKSCYVCEYMRVCACAYLCVRVYSHYSFINLGKHTSLFQFKQKVLEQHEGNIQTPLFKDAENWSESVSSCVRITTWKCLNLRSRRVVSTWWT